MSKSFIMLGMFLGSAIGGYLPLLWGDNLLSFSSVLLGGIGGLTGIWLSVKISNQYF